MKKLAILVLSAVLMLAGCANEQTFTQKNYTAVGNSIEQINIDVRDRRIEVTQSVDDKMYIYYSESDKEYYDISVSDGALTMIAASDKNWPDYIGSKPGESNRRISLLLPGKQLSALKLSTTNEDISLSGISAAGDISLHTNGGDIKFDKLDSLNTISLAAKNGDITGAIAGGYDDYEISCEIKKGKSNLPSAQKGGGKKLSVSANNGDVTIEFQK